MADDQTAELERLRARIRELEGNIASQNASPRHPKSRAKTGGLAKALTYMLAATTALMAAPAFITIRRWVRWWL
jgi:hypothetical protein